MAYFGPIKNMYRKFGFCWGDFRPDPPESGGDLKNPRGPGGVPEGIFQIPERTRGIWRKSPKQNPNFVHIFSYLLLQIQILPTFSNPKITNEALFNFKRYSKPIVSITASPLAYFIFFLSFRRNVFYKTFSFCQLVFSPADSSLFYFFDLETKGGGSRIRSRSPFTLNIYDLS